jgi:DNA-binding MarR family transcriptional regulator
MAVRQRVNQQTAMTPALEAAVGILIAADHLQRVFAEICERHGVTTDQYKVLRILREAPAGGYARGEVAERCIFSRAPDVTRMLGRLVVQRLVNRAPAADDRRCSVATITRAGRTLLSRIDPEIAAAARRLTKSLSASQLTQLTRLTESLAPED